MVYAKNKNIWRPNLLIRSNESLARYKNPDNDRRGNWKVGDLTSKTKAAGHSYPITSPSGKIFYPSSGRQWAPALSTFEKLLADNRIWFGKTGDNVPSLKQFLTEVQSGTVPLTIWLRDEVGDNQEAVQTLKGIFDGNANSFETPKPPRLIERILQIATNKNSIILDSFAGSGTTAHAVLKLNAQDGGNRQFILCEMMDYANTITAERVRRVMTGYGEGTKKVEGLGGAFDYYELGQPLFIGEYLNEIVGESKIRQYIAYSENIPPEQRTHQSAVSPYLLGINTATAWIFYYDAQRETILTVDFLATLNYRANGYTVPAHSIIYADRCVLTTAQLQRYGIQFKKTPRDITRL
jgi:adenine-specific DNA-methyltransferase